MSFGSTRIGGAKYGNTLVFQSGGVTPGRLPSGYTEVEYIENPSTARIDTGISGASSWSFTAQLIGTLSGNACVFGSYTTGGHFFAVIYSQSLKWGLGASAGQYSSVVATTKTNIEVDVVSYRQMDVRIGSESITRTGTADATGNLLLFAADTTGSYTFPGRFYGDVVGTKNGDEVFHGVPCTNPNNVAGLYDLVSATFFPSSSNVSFLAGLPLSCTPVEYIETDGAAYINTGIVGADPRSAEIRSIVRQTSNRILSSSSGVENSSNYELLGISASGYARIAHYYNYSTGMPSLQNSITNGTPFTARISMKKGSQSMSVKFDGEQSYTTVSKTDNNTISSTRTLYLFGSNTGGTPLVAASGTRVYYCKIYSDDTYGGLVFDGVPCYYNGQYGIWDKVSGTFKANSGSGAFSGPSNS